MTRSSYLSDEELNICIYMYVSIYIYIYIYSDTFICRPIYIYRITIIIATDTTLETLLSIETRSRQIEKRLFLLFAFGTSSFIS